MSYETTGIREVINFESLWRFLLYATMLRQQAKAKACGLVRAGPLGPMWHYTWYRKEGERERERKCKKKEMRGSGSQRVTREAPRVSHEGEDGLVVGLGGQQAAQVEAGGPELEYKLQAFPMALVQRRLDTYIYPVLTLPPEIVSEIFVHLLPVYPRLPSTKDFLGLVQLGQICRTWQEISVSTPSLWRAISASVPDTRALRGVGMAERLPKIIEGEIRALKTCLKRSGALGLTINFNIRLTDQEKLVPLIETVSAHSSRREHLKILSSPNHISSIQGPFPLLRTLKIYSYDGYNNFVDRVCPLTACASAPLLRRVMLEEYSKTYHFTLPWSQLIALIVDTIRAEESWHVLTLASNLVYCRLTISGQFILSSTVVLPRLETLVLRALVPGQRVNPAAGFLGSLTLPALRRLQVSETLLLPPQGAPPK
ncbi:hypothetical protein DFH06DRAFT_1432108 [Mycena polygramma]|nr:hypothetical protein DFH06DRAFT_1432108 [Mycena polygramma]